MLTEGWLFYCLHAMLPNLLLILDIEEAELELLIEHAYKVFQES